MTNTPTLLQWEAGPFNAGSNRAVQPNDIPDNEAAVIQDMFLDLPGYIYTRGQLVNVVQNNATFISTNQVVKGFFSTTAPDGLTHMACVTQDQTSNFLNMYTLTDAGGTTQAVYLLDGAFPRTWEVEVDAKPALGGGVWIGVNGKNPTANLVGRQLLFHWRGATKTQYSTGTMTSTQGSTAVTGAGTTWTTNVTPGMFLAVTHSAFIGVVKSVNSNTSITLEAPANWSFAGVAYTLDAVRAFGLEVSKGRISTTTTSTAVIGSGTKFVGQAIDTTWNIFRSRDNTFIGTVASVQGDEGLTLAGNATQLMSNEPYTMRQSPLSNATNQLILPPTVGVASGYVPGNLNCTYAQLQWFARQDSVTTVGTGDMHSRVWFSDYRNMMSVDMISVDGDFITVHSTEGPNLPIRAMAATTNALLIFKENETFVIKGNNPDQFALDKLWDDGCLSQTSVVQYKGTVIWAGRNGIYIYDGTKVQDLVGASLGNTWVDFVAFFDPRVHRMTGAVYQDHYFLTINTNGLNTSGTSPVMYTTSRNQGTVYNATLPTLSIFLPTRGLSFHTSMFLWGFAQLNNKTLFATGQHSDLFIGIGIYICDFASLFIPPPTWDFPDVSSVVNGVLTPDPYFESKRYSMGDQLRKKTIRQVIATLDIPVFAGSAFKVEVASGLAPSSTTTTFAQTTTTFPTSANLPATARVKFLKRERHVAVKFYGSNITNICPFKLRRIALGYKWLKVGRL